MIRRPDLGHFDLDLERLSRRRPSATSISSGSVEAASPASARGRVINALTIRGADQVSLRVTVAEIRRDIIKQLGVNLSGSGPNGSFTLDNPFAINGAVAASEAALNWVKGSQSFSATLQAFERQGVAHTLAEPTVTAVSGETAKFLAGGTIPILNSVQCNPVCQYGFIQQPYGVTLNFTPVVLSQGRIQLRIATEVTDIDHATQVTFSGIAIPGFRTRSNTTTVELPSGGSVASAGLISTQSEQAINGFPALMNLPVLGALFRSRDYQRNETELLITVTPYIVHAIDPEPGRSARPELPGGERSPGLVPRPRQPDLLHVAVAPADAWLFRQDRIHHPVGLACFARNFLRPEKDSSHGRSSRRTTNIHGARLEVRSRRRGGGRSRRLRAFPTRLPIPCFQASFKSAIRSWSPPRRRASISIRLAARSTRGHGRISAPSSSAIGATVRAQSQFRRLRERTQTR